MCGIVGLYAYRNERSQVVDLEELSQIRQAMKNRGPDGSGEWSSSDGRAALGHQRLAILDLSAKGAQPMATPDGRFIISFNGEIYNFKELRQALEQKGCRFESGTDTEVLLYLYAEKGEGMVRDLRGMFAFILWDSLTKKLFLARDPYGIKPLYYADDGGTFRAASQVQALLQSSKISRAKEPAGVAGFFLTGSVPEPYTIYSEIRLLPAGCTMTVGSEGASEPRAYFSLSEIFSEAAKHPNQTESSVLPDQVRSALLDSLRHHLVSDVPVCIFLSAGIDSGVLAGLAVEMGIKPPTTVTLGFGEFQDSPEEESGLAEKTAQLYGTRHLTRRLDSSQFHKTISNILQVMDQPSIDGINTYFISQAAKELGFKVALSGLGADEIFGGYPSFCDVLRWKKTFGMVACVPGLGHTARVLSYPLLKRVKPKAAGMLEYAGTYAGGYFLKRALFMPWELKFLMKKEMAEEGLRRLGLLAKFQHAVPADAGGFAALVCLESQFYMRNQLLRDADWAGMAHSVEIRLPYVDSFLVRELAPMLLRHAGAPFKKILANVPAKPLPKEVIERRKTGFTVPIAHWLESEGEWGEWKARPLLRSKRCHWSRRWAYTVLERRLAGSSSDWQSEP